jgi:glycerol-3-phosphate dehydrogenase (NAD(P)+)
MNIGILGGGAWGTALAQVAAAEGEQVVLWARNKDVVDDINTRRVNSLYLNGFALSPGITATHNFAALKACDAIFVAVPAQHVRSVLAQAGTGARALILCSKGIEAGTGFLISEVGQDVCPDAPIAVLSGPTFAHEVAARLPTAVTLACENVELGRELALRIARPYFRPYISGDVIGSEIGGAVKNVLAIACGVAEGLKLGQNARAALIARGFAEMTRFGLARGAKVETLSGLAGIGDLVLTCSSMASRNFSLGVGLGEGLDAQSLLADRRTVAEGAFTAPVLQQAARAVGVEMPVVDAVCTLLAGAQTAIQAVSALLNRPLRGEG